MEKELAIKVRWCPVKSGVLKQLPWAHPQPGGFEDYQWAFWFDWGVLDPKKRGQPVLLGYRNDDLASPVLHVPTLRQGPFRMQGTKIYDIANRVAIPWVAVG